MWPFAFLSTVAYREGGGSFDPLFQVGRETMQNQSSPGGIPMWGWVVGVVVILGVIVWAMQPAKKKAASLESPAPIVTVQQAPSIIPA